MKQMILAAAIFLLLPLPAAKAQFNQTSIVSFAFPDPINTLLGSHLYEKSLVRAKKILKSQELVLEPAQITETITPGGFINHDIVLPVRTKDGSARGKFEALVQTIGSESKVLAIRFIQ